MQKPATVAIAQYQPNGILQAIHILDYEYQREDPAFCAPGNIKVEFPIEIAKGMENEWATAGLSSTREAKEVLRYLHARAKELGQTTPRMPKPVESLQRRISIFERARDKIITQWLRIKDMPNDETLVMYKGTEDEILVTVLEAKELLLTSRDKLTEIRDNLQAEFDT